MYVSTLDASTSDAIFTMDTLVITWLTEDHHMSKSLMPSLSWANVGILTLLNRAYAKSSLLSHQAYMISDTFHHYHATLNKDICFLSINISPSIKRTSSTKYMNFRILFGMLAQTNISTSNQPFTLMLLLIARGTELSRRALLNALHNMVVHRNFIWTMHRFADHIIQYRFGTTNPQSVVNVNRPTGLQVTYTAGPIHAHPSQLASFSQVSLIHQIPKTERSNESSCVISPSLLMRR